MTIIEHENNTGFIEAELLEGYGPLSFWERIKMGGVGSPKMKYQSGIPYFDEQLNNKTDLPMVNLEIMKNALLLRLSLHQECYTVAILKSDLLNAEIRAKTDKKQLLRKNNEFMLTLKSNNQGLTHNLEFTLLNSSYNSVVKFFQKSYFSHVFSLKNSN